MSRHAHQRPLRGRYAAAAMIALSVLTTVTVLHHRHPQPRTTAAITTSPTAAVTATTARPRSAAARTIAPARTAAQLILANTHATGHLAPGSQPDALPAPILIADKFNNRLIIVDPQGRIRWQFPQPGDLTRGQIFLIPDDAFFTPDGKEIVATQEDQQLITVIDVATRHIVYRYGTPGESGSGPNQLSNPDDAIMLPDGYLLSPDIKNCRILLLSTHTHQPAQIIGTTTTNCRHAPPQHWGSPNGAFPMTNGSYLITEINGDWVSAVTLTGQLSFSTHPPGIDYPSDTNEISPNRYLTVDYSAPGQVVIFNRSGTALWRYRPTGPAALDHPSLALPLPNGDILITDDYNHRVIVLDPHTDHILWQYGIRGIPGNSPGYLNNPDGLDLLPPYALITSHRTTMGLPNLARP